MHTPAQHPKYVPARNLRIGDVVWLHETLLAAQDALENFIVPDVVDFTRFDAMLERVATAPLTVIGVYLDRYADEITILVDDEDVAPIIVASDFDIQLVERDAPPACICDTQIEHPADIALGYPDALYASDINDAGHITDSLFSPEAYTHMGTEL